jgi:hypothetical protein
MVSSPLCRPVNVKIVNLFLPNLGFGRLVTTRVRGFDLGNPPPPPPGRPVYRLMGGVGPRGGEELIPPGPESPRGREDGGVSRSPASYESFIRPVGRNEYRVPIC